jgi:uncharacterized protein (DUF1499 family)
MPAGRLERLKGVRAVLLAIALIILSSDGRLVRGQEGHATPSKELEPCPKSPNCVSTKSSESDRAMPPLPYVGTRKESFERLARVLRSMKRCSIVHVSTFYLRAEFRSALFHFVDDVEFLFDDGERQIDFRSASRTGYYDFGVNRRRLKKISDLYLNAVK